MTTTINIKKLGPYEIPDHITVKHEGTGHYVVNDSKTGDPIAEIARDEFGKWATVEYEGVNPPPAVNLDVGMNIMAKHGDVNKTAWRQIKYYFDKGVSLVGDDKTLVDFYYRGIVDFCYMISRQIPPRYKKKNPIKNEQNSSRHGIIAFKRCIKVLKGEVEYKKLEPELQNFKHLHQWYLNSIVDFIRTTMGQEIEKFKDQDPIQSAVEALTRAKATLKEQLS